MQERLADLRRINSGGSRWQQFIELEECQGKWTIQRKKTRRHCAHCGCVLYVRSATDCVTDEKDLDEVYWTHNRAVPYCFACFTQLQKAPLSTFPFPFYVSPVIDPTDYVCALSDK